MKQAMRFYSTNYLEARRKFLEAVPSAEAKVEQFQNPHNGPQGEKLYTDISLIGPKNANTFLVLSSGTHGVEGLAGSAIQTGLLREGIGSQLPTDVALLFIHAVNPYGVAHFRRTNEDNIDLNRNFTDHFKQYPANPGYDFLTDAISPKSLSMWTNAKSIMKLFRYGLTNGGTALKKAISGGQHTDSQGLFYGGRGDTWSNRTIRYIAERYLSKAEKVILIDFHTGLGPFAHAEVIMNDTEQSPAYKRAAVIWGDRVKTSTNGKSVSIHLEATLKLGFATMLPDTELTAVSLEFGTVEPVQVFWALRAENWLHHHGSMDHPRAKDIKANLLHVFYPEQRDWRMQVWEHGRTVVKEVLPQLS